jgi:hypothetical protein
VTLVSVRAVREYVEQSERARNYQGATSFVLPAGQTAAEWLAAHPEIPAMTMWTPKASVHSLRFTEDVEFVLVRPLDWGARGTVSDVRRHKKSRSRR